MAIRAKRPCRKCGTLTENKAGLCDVHLEEKKKQTLKADRERSKPFLHLYSTAWKKIRAHHLRSQPLCVMCKKEGVFTAANVVDHIQDHKGDLGMFYDRNNLQSLCTRHHNIKTCQTAGGFGNRRQI